MEETENAKDDKSHTEQRPSNGLPPLAYYPAPAMPPYGHVPPMAMYQNSSEMSFNPSLPMVASAVPYMPLWYSLPPMIPALSYAAYSGTQPPILNKKKPLQDPKKVKAAIKIQAQLRGHLARRKYGDIYINDKRKYTEPDVYLGHVIIRDVVVDYLEDILVEVTQDTYCAMKSTKSYKTLFTGYHLVHNEIYLSLSEILEELSIEFSAKCIPYGVQGFEEFGVGSWVNAQIDEETHNLVKSLINDMADEYMYEQQANLVFDLLIEELIGDMGIVEQTREQTAYYALINELIDEHIDFCIQCVALELKDELGVEFFTIPRTPPQSRLLDEIMGKMMDRVLLNFLLNNRELGQDFAMSEVADHMMDRMLVRALLEERQRSS